MDFPAHCARRRVGYVSGRISALRADGARHGGWRGSDPILPGVVLTLRKRAAWTRRGKALQRTCRTERFLPDTPRGHPPLVTIFTVFYNIPLGPVFRSTTHGSYCGGAMIA